MSSRNEKETVNYKKFKFEFLLYVNGHIICQRLFDIKNYNDEVLKSLDLKWLVDDCVGIIENDLKEKTKEQLWEYFNPYIEQTQENVDKSKLGNDKEHKFKFQIRVDRKTVVEREFDGKVYSPNVRYQVDITDIIGDLINLIRNVFTQKKFIKNYGEVEFS